MSYRKIEHLQKMLKYLRIDVTDKISCLIKKSDSKPNKRPQIKRLKYGALANMPDCVKSNFKTSFKYFGAATKKK